MADASPLEGGTTGVAGPAGATTGPRLLPVCCENPVAAQVLRVWDDLNEAQANLATWQRIGPTLEARESALRVGEADARNSFEELRAGLLDDLREECRINVELEAAQLVEHATKEAEELITAALEEATDILARARREEEKSQLRGKELEQVRKGLEATVHEADTQRARLLSAEFEILKERSELLTSVVTASSMLSEAELRARIAETRLGEARKSVDFEAWARAQLGDRDLAEVLDRVQTLEAVASDEARQRELALTQLERGELRRLRDGALRSTAQIAELREENAELAEHLNFAEANLARAEAEAGTRGAYQDMVDIYSQELDRLREELNSMRAAKTGLPFPRMSEVDDDLVLARPTGGPGAKEDQLDLSRLVTDLRENLTNPLGDPLYYSEHDIRSFLAGMAASKLILLQGPSGTGKTSLPRAVAEALRWESDVVSVQAGWRDRQDLLGYFNAFDGRFEEERFLVALYRAGSPRHVDSPFLIVLDEANLSSMEQYFATFLSALELRDEQHVDLAPRQMSTAPERTDGGTRLKIPSNAWFIATANQDETTKRFAPKTIDRGHVVELARARNWTRKPGARNLLSAVDASKPRLDAAFRAAEKAHEPESRRILERLAELHDSFDALEIGYGERFKSQFLQYLPAYLQAGGKAGPALDDLLTRKVLYRLPDPSEADQSAVQNLELELGRLWRDLKLDASPERSLGRISKAKKVAL